MDSGRGLIGVLSAKQTSVEVGVRWTRRLALAVASLIGALALMIAFSMCRAAWQVWRLPKRDASAAVRLATVKGDLRLYAWEGAGIYVPGLSGTDYDRGLRSSCDLRWLDITDVRSPWIWGRADEAGIEYAARYNALMMAQRQWQSRCTAVSSLAH